MHRKTTGKPTQKRQDVNVSFEVFPPINEAGKKNLIEVARDLEVFNPRFFSVTYGAGGSSKNRTFSALSDVSANASHVLAGHLTCVNASKSDCLDVAARYKAMGVNHIVALRGDKTPDDAVFRPHKDGYANAAQLVAGLKKTGEFEISVAAYPESHPDSPSREADLDNLKQKLDAGADQAITQFFFDNNMFYNFCDAAEKRGISKPIIPGILLIHDFWKMKKFAKMCQATVPAWLEEQFEGLENDPAAHLQVAVDIAVTQVRDLASHGVRDFHFYTMNRSNIGVAVCRALGVANNCNQRSVA